MRLYKISSIEVTESLLVAIDRVGFVNRNLINVAI